MLSFSPFIQLTFSIHRYFYYTISIFFINSIDFIKITKNSHIPADGIIEKDTCYCKKNRQAYAANA